MGRGRRLIWALHVQEMSRRVVILSFFSIYLENLHWGLRKKSSIPLLRYLAKEKFRRDGRRAKKQKGSAPGA